MSIFRKPILEWNTNPDSSGNVVPEPYTIQATNKQWAHLNWVFINAGSAKIWLYGSFEVPKNYVNNAKVIIVWTSTVTSGNWVADFAYRDVAGNDTNSLDQSGTQESVANTTAAPGAANRRMETSISLTSGNFGAGDTIEFQFGRDKSSGSDTLSGDILVQKVLFEYTDV